MMEGWIKLYRQLAEKAFYKKDSEAVHLWIHILIMANREPREEFFGGKPIICKPGQFTTGRKQLCQATGICESKIERLLVKFEKIEQQIEQQKTSTNRLISVLNWGDYQATEQQIEQRPNNDRTTTEHTTRSKEVKNSNNTILSELSVSDDTDIILKVTKSFWNLISDNLKSLDIKSPHIEKAKVEEWSKSVRLMINTDKRTTEQIRIVYNFLRDEIPDGNGFSWKANIRSTAKLREKFEALLVKAKTHKSVKPQKQSQTSEHLKPVQL